jgi:hypothetical protein
MGLQQLDRKSVPDPQTAPASESYLTLDNPTSTPVWREKTDAAVGPIIATGSSTPRYLADRFSDVVNVKDFGAVGDGTTDDTVAFQAAINSIASSGVIFVPKSSSSYVLNTNVSCAGKAISWDIQGAISGSGIIVPSNTIGFYYDNNVKNTNSVIQKGTAASPALGANAVSLVVKHSSQESDGPNPAFAGIAYKHTSTAQSRTVAVFGEAQDMVGGNGTFVEGARFHGVNTTDNLRGSVYGVIALAQSGNLVGGTVIVTDSPFVIGTESEVITFNTAALPPRSFDARSFSANFLSTVRNGNGIDAAYLVNPYNTIPAQIGFMVPEAEITNATYSRASTTVTITSENHELRTGMKIKIVTASDAGLVTGTYQTVTVIGTSGNTFTITTASTGATTGSLSYSAKPVESVAFGCYQSGLVYGLDLAVGDYSFAAISIPNNSPIRASNVAKTSELNVLFVNTSNQLVLGTQAAATMVSSPAGGALYNNVGSNTSGWHVGSVNPNTNVSALIGSLYTNTAGGAGNTLWVKESGSGTNTGWVAK